MSDRLPIYELETELVTALHTRRRAIISAPTGSGKSTQVPQMLLRHGLLGDGQVVILQPRRLAARLLAKRVAEELGVPLGREVGYSIRFENVSSPATRIRFVTEGVLLRQMIDDPELRGIAALIFDEFHERHLYGDITLARALDLQEHTRPDLRLLVMSATLDLDLLADYLGAGRPSKASRHAGAPVHGEFRPPTLDAHRGHEPSPPHPALGHPLPHRGRGQGEGAVHGKGCAILTSEGRVFPVEIEYAPEPSYRDQRPVWEQAAAAFAAQIRAGMPGDVLVFMPGGYEIAQTIEAIRRLPESRGFILLPLHGELPAPEQDAAVARHAQRKVVVATNVAETSLTIDGIRLVIDSGLARIPRYDPRRGINTLLIEKISRAAAEQRAGRAGRTAPGKCVRLWSEREHADRPEQELPEIKRLDLAEVVLTLKAAGVEDLRAFRWLEPPDEKALAHAEALLEDLGALKPLAPAGTCRAGFPTCRIADVPIGKPSEGKPPAGSERGEPADAEICAPGAAPARPGLCITPLGRKMLAFPVHPRYARMLLAAQEYGCVHQACLVAALTQGRDLLVRSAGRESRADREDLLGEKAASDFWILMRAWNFAVNRQFQLEACRRLGIHAATARQVGPLFEQFLRIARDEGLDTTPRQVPDEALQKCILIGFSDRVARRLDAGTRRCELVHGRRGELDRDSVVQHSPLLVAAEIREIGGRNQEVNTVLSLATAIEADWLRELFPEDIHTEQRVQFDSVARRVVAEEVTRFRDLTIAARRIEPPPADEAARLLAQEVACGRLPLPGWDHAVEQWLLRLRLLCEHCPELQLPPFTDAARRAVLEQLVHGAVSFKELKERPVKPLVMAWLSPAQRALLDQHAPERLTLANGRTPKVVYEPGALPHIALRIQELYGVTQTPRVAMGRVPVVVHILTPGMKPVQVTQDLANFWREQYPRVKQELQRKYPKHEWR